MSAPSLQPQQYRERRKRERIKGRGTMKEERKKEKEKRRLGIDSLELATDAIILIPLSTSANSGVFKGRT